MLVSIRGLRDLEFEMAPTNNGRSIRKRSVGVDGEDAIDVRSISLPRRPIKQISSIEVSNIVTANASWKMFEVGKGAWVLMQPKRSKKRSKKQQSTSAFLTSWKGRVKGFRVKEGRRCVKEILVQHVYMHRELQLREYPAYLPHHKPNCKHMIQLKLFSRHNCCSLYN